MLLHRRFIVCCLLCWSENRLFRFNFKRGLVARAAGNCPLAKAIYGRERGRDAALIEPVGNLAVSPMLAPQGEDGFAVRFELAARPARHFVFSLLLQIHFLISLFEANNSVRRLRNFCGNFAQTRGLRRAPLAVLREDV